MAIFPALQKLTHICKLKLTLRPKQSYLTYLMHSHVPPHTPSRGEHHVALPTLEHALPFVAGSMGLVS